MFVSILFAKRIKSIDQHYVNNIRSPKPNTLLCSSSRSKKQDKRIKNVDKFQNSWGNDSCASLFLNFIDCTDRINQFTKPRENRDSSSRLMCLSPFLRSTTSNKSHQNARWYRKVQRRRVYVFVLISLGHRKQDWRPKARISATKRYHREKRVYIRLSDQNELNFTKHQIPSLSVDSCRLRNDFLISQGR
jgi:hypothetical protein